MSSAAPPDIFWWQNRGCCSCKQRTGPWPETLDRPNHFFVTNAICHSVELSLAGLPTSFSRGIYG